MSVALDTALFRAQCPEFSDDVKFPQALIEAFWEIAQQFVETEGSPLGNAVGVALNYMTAHLLSLSQRAAKGKQTGFKTYAMVDKVSTQWLAPETADQFDWWLLQTPYGQQLHALVSIKMVGGFSVAGWPETTALKHWGGLS